MIIVQLAYGSIDKVRQSCIDVTRETASAAGVEYAIVRKARPVTTEAYYRKKHADCFSLAEELPEMLYVDTDCALGFIPSFPEKDLPCFGFCDGRPDTFVFYVNNREDFFHFMLRKVAGNVRIDCWWPLQLLSPEVVQEFPSEAFYHHRLTSNSWINRCNA
jgi:hypothetical protein